MKPAQRKQIVKYLVSAGRHSVRAACKLVGFSRSTYRYKPKRANKDGELEAALLERAKQYPHYGCAKLHGLLKKEGLTINLKRTYRLYKNMSLNRDSKGANRLSSLLRADGTDNGGAVEKVPPLQK